jgi:NDP-sugar pyrophosphorylase family protein
MKAVILAGGEGTRLRPLTYSIPKPLLPIGRKPILEIIIERLRDHGFTDIILNVGYKAELIEAYFRDGSNLEVNITYFRENSPKGTCGPVKLVEHLINNQPFVTMNGDLLTDLNFSEMWQFHIKKSAELTMAVRDYNFKLPYGIVYIDKDKICSIEEKPELWFLINAGVYILSPSALEIVPRDKFFDMTDLIQTLINRGGKVETYFLDCEWRDLGTMESYEAANVLHLEEMEEKPNLNDPESQRNPLLTKKKLYKISSHLEDAYIR